MRRLSLIVVAILFIVANLSAQQFVTKRVGLYSEDGVPVLADASTTLALDLTVQHEEFVAGPYARYAQKYLGSRASQMDRSIYSIVDAQIAVAADDYYMAGSFDAKAGQGANVDLSFPQVLPDKLSSRDMSLEDAAAAAAEQILQLRKVRLELITGELGDGVYGAGLQSALAEIERLEKSYLELFYGKSAVSYSSCRIYLPVDASRKTMIAARFNSDEGLLNIDNLDGDIVMVNIVPSNVEYPASNPKGKVEYRFANNSTVVVSLGQEVLINRVLPIYEFGQTVVL